MISRKTTLTLSELYSSIFYTKRKGRGDYNRTLIKITDTYRLYDFLFNEGYDAMFCSIARQDLSGFNSVRPLKDFILGLHTGDSLNYLGDSTRMEQRNILGQKYLLDLTEDILNYCYSELPPEEFKNIDELLKKLVYQLELDGYAYSNSKIFIPEEDILNVEEERSYLKDLYSSLKLSNEIVAFHNLDLSEEHYIAGRWDDAISNSRKFLECILQEIAYQYYSIKKGTVLSKSVYESPSQIRDILLEENLLEIEEKEAFKAIYGLLSHTGSHPYMAQKDQAKLLRQLALTLTQFALLRYQGAI